jgi:hypothetical protein
MPRLHAPKQVGNVWTWFVHQMSPRALPIEDKARTAAMFVHLAPARWDREHPGRAEPS